MTGSRAPWVDCIATLALSRAHVVYGTIALHSRLPRCRPSAPQRLLADCNDHSLLPEAASGRSTMSDAPCRTQKPVSAE